MMLWSYEKMRNMFLWLFVAVCGYGATPNCVA